MSQVSDVSLANQGFSSYRTENNNILGALNSMHSGTSRPSSAVQGTMWLDTTNSGSNSLEIKFFDGSDDITFATVDTSANTINFSDAATDVVGDTTPQLGGDLDTNSFNIKIDDAHFIADDDGNEQLIFQKTASAVNELEITNAATGNAPSLGASGETNVDLKILPKGSGEIVIGTGSADATLTSNGTHNLILDTNSGTNSSNITIVDGANGDIEFTNNGTGNVKFNDAAYFPEATLTDASTISWDTQAAPVAKVTLTDNRTLGAGSNAVAGQFVSLLVIQDGTGSRTLSFNAVYEFTEDTAPTLTTTASKGDLFVFRYNGSKFLEVGRNLNLTLS